MNDQLKDYLVDGANFLSGLDPDHKAFTMYKLPPVCSITTADSPVIVNKSGFIYAGPAAVATIGKTVQDGETFKVFLGCANFAMAGGAEILTCSKAGEYRVTVNKIPGTFLTVTGAAYSTVVSTSSLANCGTLTITHSGGEDLSYSAADAGTSFTTRISIGANDTLTFTTAGGTLDTLGWLVVLEPQCTNISGYENTTVYDLMADGDSLNAKLKEQHHDILCDMVLYNHKIVTEDGVVTNSPFHKVAALLDTILGASFVSADYESIINPEWWVNADFGANLQSVYGVYKSHYLPALWQILELMAADAAWRIESM
jgi:hypothetical protein